MKKTILCAAVSAALFSSMTSAQVTEATLYPNGGVLTWEEKSSIKKGNHSLTISNLPVELDEQSLQAGFKSGSKVSIRQVSVFREEQADVVSPEMKALLVGKAGVVSMIAMTDYRIDVMDNQVKLTTQVAENPGDEITPESIEGIAKNLESIRSNAYKTMHELRQSRSELLERKDLIDRKIQSMRSSGKTTKAVKIDYYAEEASDAGLNLRFRLPTVGWQSTFDARLNTNNESVLIEHKALIRQQSGLNWENIDLTLSMMRPSEGAGLPDPNSWDIHRKKPQPQRQAMSLRAKSADMASMSMMESAHQANLVSDGTKTQSYRITGQVTLGDQSASQSMVIDNHKLDADLKTHFMPYHTENGYVVAHATYEGEGRLQPARVTLYRDGQMIGPWTMPEMRPGEDVEIGFGVDDRVSLDVINEENKRGTSGIVSKENTLERLNRYEVTNHYKDSVDVRIIERLPVSRHEDIKVTHHTISRPFINAYKDQEGVIAWDRSLQPHESVSLTSGFEVKVPEDQEI